MTGYESKRAAARDKLDNDDTQVYQTELTKLLMESYDKGVADALAEIKAARDKMAQPAQEPVGVVCVDTSHAHIIYGSQYLGRQPDKKTAMFFKDCEVGEQLYTLPPKRPWVGLTDDAEIFAISNTMPYADRFEFARAIEAKLKEKNT
jgi:hypothetical protein